MIVKLSNNWSSTDKYWEFANRVWERAKKNPVMGFRALGPLPVKQVHKNRLLALKAIAEALAPNIPADHWRIRAAYLALIDRHMGPAAKTRAKAKMKQVGARYTKPQPVVHVDPRQEEIRNRGWEISRRRALEAVQRDAHAGSIQGPNPDAVLYPEATGLLKTLKDFTDSISRGPGSFDKLST